MPESHTHWGSSSHQNDRSACAPSAVSLFPTLIFTARLTLAPPADDARDIIFNGWASDAAVTRYLGWKTAGVPADLDGFFKRAASGWANQSEFTWLVAEIASGETIGAVSARVSGHRVEFGYVLRARSWGRGYMPEVLVELVRRSFEIPAIHRVGAFCDADNFASTRVMEKAGLTREGLLRAWFRHPQMSPHPRDCWSYALTRAEFSEATANQSKSASLSSSVSRAALHDASA